VTKFQLYVQITVPDKKVAWSCVEKI